MLIPVSVRRLFNVASEPLDVEADGLSDIVDLLVKCQKSEQCVWALLWQAKLRSTFVTKRHAPYHLTMEANSLRSILNKLIPFTSHDLLQLSSYL